MMKITLNSILLASLTMVCFVQSQTYTIDGTGGPVTCTGNTGIAATYSTEIWSTSTPTALGSFTDTNSAGRELSELSVKVYYLKEGSSEVYLNGESLGAITYNNQFGECPDLSKVEATLDVNVTTALKEAYKIGDINTLSIKRLSGDPGHYFYGAVVSVTTQSALGLSDSNPMDFKVIPNPTQDFLVISGIQSTKRYRVYNIFGSEVLSGEVSKHQKVDVRVLHKGLYFLSLTDHDRYFKFIKK